MYELKTYDKLSRIDLIWEDKEKQLLSNFLSDFDKTIYCELARAVARIKEGTLDDYGAAMDLYFFSIDKDGIFIEYQDGLTPPTQKRYSLAELEDMMKIYHDEVEKNLDIDLDAITEDYEPMIEGIIEPEMINDSREKRFG